MGTDRIDSRSWHRFDAAALQGFAEGLLRRAGLSAEQARQTADILVEADLMGHTTHGLQLLSGYLRDIEAGRMCSDGEPEVVRDQPNAITWDGRYLPGPWLVDNRGEASDDPRVMLTDPPGAILPLGGIELGHKGFALALLVEALTSGLAGQSRGAAQKRWGASVFLQLIDPAAFGGREAFEHSTGWLAADCRSAPVKPGNPAVRLPGERALALRRRQQAEGVAVHPEVMPSLAPFAERWQIAAPKAAD